MRHRRAWYELGLHQPDDLGAVIGRSLEAAPGVTLTFMTGGARQAAVLGVPDERYGERLLAVVVPRPGAALDLVQRAQLLRTWERRRPVHRTQAGR